jgi:hypothetical protein
LGPIEASFPFFGKSGLIEVRIMRARHLNSPERQRFLPSPGAKRGALLMGFLLALPLGGAQNSPTGHIGGLPQPITPGFGDTPSPLGNVNGGPDEVEDARRIRMLNAERQRSLVADTVKLLKLANALNATIAKEDASAPTQIELREIADIEKLAHNVKEKMKITVIGTPIYRQPTMNPIP